jgi:catechol 2,3-dioxygenase-like lactoylglutathione lyase family enzyme
MIYKGIEHSAIGSHDTERLARWYVDTLGFRIKWENDKTPRTYLLEGSEGGMLEILPAREPLKQVPARDEPGMRHLAIAVADWESALADLKQKETNFVSEPMASHGNRIVFFRDCDGNILHLIWRPVSS